METTGLLATSGVTSGMTREIYVLTAATCAMTAATSGMTGAAFVETTEAKFGRALGGGRRNGGGTIPVAVFCVFEQ